MIYFTPHVSDFLPTTQNWKLLQFYMRIIYIYIFVTTTYSLQTLNNVVEMHQCNWREREVVLKEVVNTPIPNSPSTVAFSQLVMTVIN